MQKGKAQISVHYKGVCMIVDNVHCSVPVDGRIKKTQPRFVMVGKASNIAIINGEAVIT